MGLDVRAFNGLERCQIQTEEAYEKYLDCSCLRSSDILFNQSGGLDGYYTHSGEYLTFRAGSYSSYGNWRKMLSEMLGYPEIEKLWESIRREISLGEVLPEGSNVDIPFIELIYFSDCEGVIGSKVSTKLYNDFVSNRESAVKFSESKKNSDWLSLYDDFLKAFKIASNNGCVQFC